MIKVLICLLVLVALAFIAKGVVEYLDWMGYYQRTFNHVPGPCRKLEGIVYGSEDIEVLPDGMAFITSGLRLRDTDVYNKRPGRIYAFDFNKSDDAPRELTVNADSDFELISPHGISIWSNTSTDKNSVYLYVISHQPVEIVDKFKFNADNASLTHLKRIAADKNFHVLNDLAVVGEDKFYFTNYFYSSLDAELLLNLPYASLGFYNGATSELIDEGLHVANGVALSPDKKFLYVAQYAAENIRVYRRHVDNSITYLHSIDLHTKPDNLDVDSATGDVWIGAHPNIVAVMHYIEDPDRYHSPSQVLRVKMSPNATVTSIDEIFSDDGKFFSGSTVAVVHGKGLLIGSVASEALYCEIQ